MKRFCRSVSLLLPSLTYLFIYWTITISLIVLIGFGMQETSPTTATFWALSLEGFGMTSEHIIRSSYREMVFHVFTLLAIPFCLFANVRLFDTFENEFVQFLRYSRSSRLRAETIRLTALLTILVFIGVPLLFAAIFDTALLGIPSTENMAIFTRTFGILLFLSTFVYALVSLPGMTKSIAVGCGICLPFILSGIHVFLEKNEAVPLLQKLLPVGLPYVSNSYMPGTVVDRDMLSCYIIAIFLLVFRLAVCAKTSWIYADRLSKIESLPNDTSRNG